MVSTNGKKPRQAQQPARLPVVPKEEVRRLSMPGDTVILGETEYHLARLTTYGAQDLRSFIDAAGFPVFNAEEGDSIGMVLVSASLALGYNAALTGLMQRAIYEPVTEQTVMEATPDQLVAAVDGLLEQSGIQWLTRILKNSIPALAGPIHQRLERVLQEQVSRMTDLLDQPSENAPTGTESALEILPASS